MEANKILSADILDIIFDGKNKEYGAYQLRKSYKKTLTKALAITGLALLLVLLGTVFAGIIEKNKPREINVLDTQMAEVKENEPPPPPPPPPLANAAMHVDRSLDDKKMPPKRNVQITLCQGPHVKITLEEGTPRASTLHQFNYRTNPQTQSSGVNAAPAAPKPVKKKSVKYAS